MRKGIGEVLRELRKRNGYMQQDVVKRLAAMGIDVNKNHVSRWENGYNSPSIEQFLGLCRIYSVKDPCSVFLDNDFSELSTGLDSRGFEKLEEYRRLLIASRMYSPAGDKADIVVLQRRTLPVFDVGASAGTGQFLDSDSYEMEEVPDGVPGDAMFGLHVCGDSMEPTLSDGELIFVHRQPEIEDGEIGVFLLDGNAFVKELSVQDGGMFLCSHNKSYAPIPVREYDEFRVYGKVVYPAI